MYNINDVWGSQVQILHEPVAVRHTIAYFLTKKPQFLGQCHWVNLRRQKAAVPKSEYPSIITLSNFLVASANLCKRDVCWQGNKILGEYNYEKDKH